MKYECKGIQTDVHMNRFSVSDSGVLVGVLRVLSPGVPSKNKIESSYFSITAVTWPTLKTENISIRLSHVSVMLLLFHSLSGMSVCSFRDLNASLTFFRLDWWRAVGFTLEADGDGFSDARAGRPGNVWLSCRDLLQQVHAAMLHVNVCNLCSCCHNRSIGGKWGCVHELERPHSLYVFPPAW